MNEIGFLKIEWRQKGDENMHNSDCVTDMVCATKTRPLSNPSRLGRAAIGWGHKGHCFSLTQFMLHAGHALTDSAVRQASPSVNEIK